MTLAAPDTEQHEWSDIQVFLLKLFCRPMPAGVNSFPVDVAATCKPSVCNSLGFVAPPAKTSRRAASDGVV